MRYIENNVVILNLLASAQRLMTIKVTTLNLMVIGTMESYIMALLSTRMEIPLRDYSKMAEDIKGL
jgi:hypothetical protein